MQSSPPYTTEGPFFERVQILEPIKWAPQILQQRSAKGTHTKGLGMMSVGFGVAMLMWIGLMALQNFGIIQLDETKLETALFLGICLFAIPLFVMFIWWGEIELNKERKIRLGNETHPQEPWLWEGDWTSRGVKDKKLQTIVCRSIMVWGGWTFFPSDLLFDHCFVQRARICHVVNHRVIFLR